MATVRKHSRKRDAILACLRSTTCHPTAEWVYQQLKPAIPDLSLGTVYRNLSMFKDEGLVISVGTVGGLDGAPDGGPDILDVDAPGAEARGQNNGHGSRGI